MTYTAAAFVVFALLPLSAPVVGADCDATILTGSSSNDRDLMGLSLAIDGSVAIAGAPQPVLLNPGPGTASVFRYSEAGGWRYEQRMGATDREDHDSFGQSVGIRGDRALVGAPHDDDLGESSGSAYIFDYDGERWRQTQKLVAPDGAEGHWFGEAVALGEDEAFVGAPLFSYGAVYRFRLVDGTWTWTETLRPQGNDGFFGLAIVVTDDRLLVGAPRGVLETGIVAGAVYVYRRDGAAWIPDDRLVPSDGGHLDFFGARIATHGDVIAVGSILKRVEGIGNRVGAAYVFRKGEGGWLEEQSLVSSVRAEDDYFGSVAVLGDRMLVGASSSRNEEGVVTGNAYAFEYDGGAWVETARFCPPEIGVGDNFGAHVGLGEFGALVSAPYNDERGLDRGALFAIDVATCLCGEDVSGDGVIGFADILLILANWGPCESCPADTNGDGAVGFADVLAVLAAWGSCQ